MDNLVVKMPQEHVRKHEQPMVPRGRKVFLRRVSLSDELKSYALDLHATAKCDETVDVSDATALRSFLNVDRSIAMLAEKREDGLLLRCGNTHESGVDAVIRIGYSKMLGKPFANAFVPSESVVKVGTLCVDVLDNVFLRWKELRNGRTDDLLRVLGNRTLGNAMKEMKEEKGNMKRDAVRDMRRDDIICIQVLDDHGNKSTLEVPMSEVREIACHICRSQVQGDNCTPVTVSIGKGNLTVELQGDVNSYGKIKGVVKVDKTPVSKYEVKGGVYAMIVQTHVQGYYIQGMRSMLCAIRENFPECQNPQKITEPVPSNLASLCKSVQSMNLVCTKDPGSLVIMGKSTIGTMEMFKKLNIKLEAAKKHASAKQYSVYCMSMLHSAPQIMNKGVLKFICKHALDENRAKSMLSGAYAVHAALGLGEPNHHHNGPGSGALSNALSNLPVSLDMPIGQGKSEMIDIVSNQHCPTYFLNWNNAVVSMHYVKDKGFVFKSVCKPEEPEQGVTRSGVIFATFHLKRETRRMVPKEVSGSETKEKAEIHQSPKPQVPETQSRLRDAAHRLAKIEELSLHPQYTPFAKALRSVWLCSEQERIANSPSYFEDMCTLVHLASMPVGYNYWAMVPFL